MHFPWIIPANISFPSRSGLSLDRLSSSLNSDTFDPRMLPDSSSFGTSLILAAITCWWGRPKSRIRRLRSCASIITAEIARFASRLSAVITSASKNDKQFDDLRIIYLKTYPPTTTCNIRFSDGTGGAEARSGADGIDYVMTFYLVGPPQIE